MSAREGYQGAGGQGHEGPETETSPTTADNTSTFSTLRNWQPDFASRCRAALVLTGGFGLAVGCTRMNEVLTQNGNNIGQALEHMQGSDTLPGLIGAFALSLSTVVDSRLFKNANEK